MAVRSSEAGGTPLSKTSTSRNAVAIVIAEAPLIARLATVVQASPTEYSTTTQVRPKTEPTASDGN
jgi:hypothetical protein